MPNREQILFVDAYDSFTRNIVALCYESIPNIDVTLIHIDTDIDREYGLDLATFVSRFSAVILGPGPGHPGNASDIGLFNDILDLATSTKTPLLGICLGFQVLCLRHGCNLVRMPLPCHGQQKLMHTTGRDLFAELETGYEVKAMCYNSLAVRTTDFGPLDKFLDSASSSGTSTPRSNSSSTASFEMHNCDNMKLLAVDGYGYAMAVKHDDLPHWGVQFHPESCCSEGGNQTVRNWWSMVTKYNRKSQRRLLSPVKPRGRRLEEEQHAISLPSTTSTNLAHVQWRMSKFECVKSEHLSRLCHESNKGGPLAMLESTAKGRYCIYGFTNTNNEIVEYAAGQLCTRSHDRILSTTSLSAREALAIIRNKTRSAACKSGCPKIPFWGGYMGYLSYEMGLDLLAVDSKSQRIVPDFSFVFVERSVVLDQRTGDICIQSIRPDDQSWIRDMHQQLKAMNGPRVECGTADTARCLNLHHASSQLPDKQQYERNYTIVTDHLHAGNSYELCLTTEATVEVPHTADTAFLLYQNLNKHNPVPHAAMMHFPCVSDKVAGTTILSTSPELFLSCTRTGTLDMMPMKGTVQRTPDTKIEDVYEILNSPKESAENLMIADLIRHDLYSVVGCEPYPWFEQSPDPTKPAVSSQIPWRTLQSQRDKDNNASQQVAHAYSQLTRSPLSILALNSIKPFETVYQLVSHIRAHPPPSLDTSDPRAVISHNLSALDHVLPPGSMTGAPKKRSCEILQGLEQRSRGVYSGIIGYMDVGGGSCWSVAIRTAWSSDSEDRVVDSDVGTADQDEADTVHIEKRKVWHVGAGGAVTVLSGLEGEWQEMMGKMNNVLKGFREVKHDFPSSRPG